MTYTARDYTALAKAIAPTLSDARHTDISAEAAIHCLIVDIADTLQRLNPRFDRVRFQIEIDNTMGISPAKQEPIQNV